MLDQVARSTVPALEVIVDPAEALAGSSLSNAPQYCAKYEWQVEDRGTDEAPESHASRFHLDLEHWVTEVSEVFHYRIFFIDPLPTMCSANFCNLCEAMNLPIATKYAYTSSQTWESFNRKEIDEKYRAYQNMLVGWYMIPEENFALQAEVAFVGVIGSSAQRSEVAVRFLPWPRNEIDLLAMRKRVDVSSKTMFFAPTGEILRPRSCRRKAARRRIMGRDETLPECQMQSLYDGMSKFKSSSARSLNKIRSSVHGQES
ncbi:Uncharacterized protein SCF082_LOCUS28691, partial [Durusdinium trenchii]